MSTETAVWERQETSLAAYARDGTISRAAKAAGLSRETHYRWRNEDVEGYRGHFDAVKDEFRDSLEGLLFDRLQDPKCHPLLIIFAMKAHLPEKYRELPLKDDAAFDTLRELRSMAVRQRKAIAEGNGVGSLEGGGTRHVDERGGPVERHNGARQRARVLGVRFVDDRYTAPRGRVMRTGTRHKTMVFLKFL